MIFKKLEEFPILTGKALEDHIYKMLLKKGMNNLLTIDYERTTNDKIAPFKICKLIVIFGEDMSHSEFNIEYIHEDKTVMVSSISAMDRSREIFLNMSLDIEKLKDPKLSLDIVKGFAHSIYEMLIKFEYAVRVVAIFVRDKDPNETRKNNFIKLLMHDTLVNYSVFNNEAPPFEYVPIEYIDDGLSFTYTDDSDKKYQFKIQDYMIDNRRSINVIVTTKSVRPIPCNHTRVIFKKEYDEVSVTSVVYDAVGECYGMIDDSKHLSESDISLSEVIENIINYEVNDKTRDKNIIIPISNEENKSTELIVWLSVKNKDMIIPVIIHKMRTENSILDEGFDNIDLDELVKNSKVLDDANQEIFANVIEYMKLSNLDSIFHNIIDRLANYITDVNVEAVKLTRFYCVDGIMNYIGSNVIDGDICTDDPDEDYEVKEESLEAKEEVKESVREYIKDIKEMNSEDSSTETEYEQSTFFKQEIAEQLKEKGIATLTAVNDTVKKLESLDIKIEEKEPSGLEIIVAKATASKEQSNKFQDNKEEVKMEKKKKSKSLTISMRKKLAEKMKVIDELDRNYAVKKLKETKIFKKLYKEIIAFTANPKLVKVPGSYKALIKIVNKNDIYERREAILSFKYMVDSGTVNVYMDDEEIYMIGGYLSSMTYKKAHRLTKIILYTIIKKMQIKDISKFEYMIVFPEIVNIFEKKKDKKKKNKCIPSINLNNNIGDINTPLKAAMSTISKAALKIVEDRKNFLEGNKNE